MQVAKSVVQHGGGGRRLRCLLPDSVAWEKSDWLHRGWVPCDGVSSGSLTSDFPMQQAVVCFEWIECSGWIGGRGKGRGWLLPHNCSEASRVCGPSLRGWRTVSSQVDVGGVRLLCWLVWLGLRVVGFAL